MFGTVTGNLMSQLIHVISGKVVLIKRTAEDFRRRMSECLEMSVAVNKIISECT